jgi:hypothetical protein
MISRVGMGRSSLDANIEDVVARSKIIEHSLALEN